MTDSLVSGDASGSTPGAQKTARMRRRNAAETRFRVYGLSAIIIAVMFLVILLSSIIVTALPALRFHFLTLPGDHKAQTYGLSARPDAGELKQTDAARKIVRDSIRAEFPHVRSRNERRALARLYSRQASLVLADKIASSSNPFNDPDVFEVPLSDEADLYLKGLVTDKEIVRGDAAVRLSELDGIVSGRFDEPVLNSIYQDLLQNLSGSATGLKQRAQNRRASVESLTARIDQIRSELVQAEEGAEVRLSTELEKRLGERDDVQREIDGFLQQAARLEEIVSSGSIVMAPDLKSVLIEANGGVVKVTEVGPTTFKGEVLQPLQSFQTDNEWTIQLIEKPETQRKFSDRDIVWIDHLVAKGYVRDGLNTLFFTRATSTDPEMAGIYGALIGSLLTLLVTLLISFPVGVAAAIYLEEFAPKNRLTAIIEVNINNLAAVPSIVFGLLGLAIFINWFEFERSLPVVGGMVLSLMTLPTIIIASRAALKAVPPSIREAALGIGASRVQMVFHHVLPLAMPGILTGSIIGMAQALGETAPLLLIGMNAFVVDIPSNPLTDPSTVLPAQVFQWANQPEPAFVQKTSLAIMVLLGFLILMNSAAVFVRKAFERRW